MPAADSYATPKPIFRIDTSNLLGVLDLSVVVVSLVLTHGFVVADAIYHVREMKAEYIAIELDKMDGRGRTADMSKLLRDADELFGKPMQNKKNDTLPESDKQRKVWKRVEKLTHKSTTIDYFTILFSDHRIE